jgi:hypothetical protein
MVIDFSTTRLLLFGKKRNYSRLGFGHRRIYYLGAQKNERGDKTKHTSDEGKTCLPGQPLGVGGGMHGIKVKYCAAGGQE